MAVGPRDLQAVAHQGHVIGLEVHRDVGDDKAFLGRLRDAALVTVAVVPQPEERQAARRAVCPVHLDGIVAQAYE